jgi:hypothetical protein
VVVLFILPLFAVSCGGSSSSSTSKSSEATRVVYGPGFRFTAPAHWSVRRTTRSVAARSPSDRSVVVSATVYRLGKPYTADQFDAAARELDGVAKALARAAGGSVTASETTTVDGRRIRAYRFTATSSGRPYEDRVGFVLDGRRELQLLCQAPAGSDDPAGACARLFDTFSLSGAG